MPLIDQMFDAFGVNEITNEIAQRMEELEAADPRVAGIKDVLGALRMQIVYLIQSDPNYPTLEGLLDAYDVTVRQRFLISHAEMHSKRPEAFNRMVEEEKQVFRTKIAELRAKQGAQ